MALSRRADAAMGGEQIGLGLMHSTRPQGNRFAGALLCTGNCGKGQA